MLDTCAITWYAQQPDGMSRFDSLFSAYRLLIPTPVLYELAFGPEELVGANERLIREHLSLSGSANCIDQLQYTRAQRQGQIKAGGYYILNPGYFEWFSARDRLLRYIDLSNAKHGKSKREYSLDALIHSCARNCFAPICTANISDFKKMNRAGALSAHDGTVPIFSPEQVLLAVSSDVCYEDETSLKKHLPSD